MHTSLLLLGALCLATPCLSHVKKQCSPEEESKLAELQTNGLGDDHWSFSLLPGISSRLKRSANTRTQKGQFTYLTGRRRCPKVRNYPQECPVHYVLHYDLDRIPQVMVHVRCSCQKRYRPVPGFSACRPVMTMTKVLRKQGCEYVEAYEELPVACAYQVIAPNGPKTAS